MILFDQFKLRLQFFTLELKVHNTSRIKSFIGITIRGTKLSLSIYIGMKFCMLFLILNMNMELCIQMSDYSKILPVKIRGENRSKVPLQQVIGTWMGEGSSDETAKTEVSCLSICCTLMILSCMLIDCSQNLQTLSFYILDLSFETL